MIAQLASTLTRHLMRFNAKERDHLMRLAYLGEVAPYGSSPMRFLSPQFTALLQPVVKELGLGDSASCVFAGMDYHLDWLHAALTLTLTHRDMDETLDDDAHANTGPFPMEQAPEIATARDALYRDFRPVMGNQEDVDLLVVFADASRIALLLVEAKGAADFDRVQLARKLIRLDGILVAAGMHEEGHPIRCRLVLASPAAPAFIVEADGIRRSVSCREYAGHFPAAKTADDKFSAMRARLTEDAHPSRLGHHVPHVSLGNYPRHVFAVKRVKADAAAGYSHWNVVERRKRFKGEQ